MTFSFFTPDAEDADVLVPEDLARSLWGTDQMHGVALSGMLSRALERTVAELGRDDLRAARYTVDLFKAARMQPCRTSVRVVREGNRLCLVDATVEQDGVPVARASGLFLKVGEQAPGAVWEPTDSPQPPPPDVAPPTDDPHVPLFASDGAGWSDSFGEHQNAGHKTTWQVAVPVVPGERPSGFVAAASVADATSMVTNWGANGVEHINTDITLTLARAPEGVEIGLAASDRVSADGIAVGTATVFDRAGRLGTAVTTSIANVRRGIDFGREHFSEDPRPLDPHQ
ncbi:MAG: thioesterase family protein [Marmoricola sp.]|nr:thioesterase family protein [Marmoricola sp.]